MLDFIVGIAHEAGKIALAYFNGEMTNSVHAKATANDLVSLADKAVEEKIISMIRARFPDHAVFGEETGHHVSASEYEWVIDPIDGTQSFVKSHPYFSISIALFRNGKSEYGVVYAPALGILFKAERGKGAFKNGKRIHVSDCTDLREAACSTGFACLRANRKRNNIPVFAELVPVIRDIKRCGSAALDLCFTGAGTYDAYWEYSLQPYDVGAGALIAQEGGALVCDLEGGNDYPAKGIVTATPALLPQILPYVKGKFF